MVLYAQETRSLQILTQHVMLGALGPVKREVEEATRLHHPPHVRQALLDEVLLRIENHEAVAVVHVLHCQVQQERALAGAGRSEDMQVAQTVVGGDG